MESIAPYACMRSYKSVEQFVGFVDLVGAFAFFLSDKNEMIDTKRFLGSQVTKVYKPILKFA